MWEGLYQIKHKDYLEFESIVVACSEYWYKNEIFVIGDNEGIYHQIGP